MGQKGKISIAPFLQEKFKQGSLSSFNPDIKIYKSCFRPLGIRDRIFRAEGGKGCMTEAKNRDA